MLGIITAVTDEKNAVLKKMVDTTTSTLYNIEFHEGKINNIKCVLTTCGVGKINAARCTQLMIDTYHPTKIINIGSAGALSEHLNIGDVIISSSCIQHDLDLTAFGCKKGCFSDTDNGFIEADLELIELCRKSIHFSSNKNFQIFIEPIATGDQFYNLPDKKKALFLEFGTHCVDMEGAAIAQVCFYCSIPFVVIRSISDKLNDMSELVYFDYNKLASERCADFLENLTQKMVEDNSANKE